MSISEFEIYLKEHDELICIPNGSPAIGDPMRLGRMKPSDNFKDRLKEIKKTHKHSNINTF